MPQNNDTTPAGAAAPAATDGSTLVPSTSLTALSCASFASELASRKPVPGGGGAAAYVGALAAALCSMVGNFTVGKPRYVAVEADVLAAMAAPQATSDCRMREPFWPRTSRASTARAHASMMARGGRTASGSAAWIAATRPAASRGSA